MLQRCLFVVVLVLFSFYQMRCVSSEPIQKKKLYLASPYGFSREQKARLLPEIVEKLESLGAEVLEPFQKNNQKDFTKPGWAYEIGQQDLNDVREADGIFAVINGTPPDEGVMVELGFAIALNKKIFLFRDDFRRCTDSEDYPLNLMIFSGLPKEEWQDYYYRSLQEISSPKRVLYKWLKASK